MMVRTSYTELLAGASSKALKSYIYANHRGERGARRGKDCSFMCPHKIKLAWQEYEASGNVAVQALSG